MDSLGGARAIEDACFADGNAPPLELRCRPTDPLSHPLFGERAPTNGIVLRIARSKRRPTTAAGAAAAVDVDAVAAKSASRSSVDEYVRVEAVGRITHLVQFKGMADFQHTRAAEDPELAARSGVAVAAATRDPAAGTAFVAVARGHPFACGVPDGPKSDPFRMAERAELALAGVPATHIHPDQQRGQRGAGARPEPGRQPWVGSLVMVLPIYSKVDEPEVGTRPKC